MLLLPPVQLTLAPLALLPALAAAWPLRVPQELHGPSPLDAAQQLAAELAARAHQHSQDPTYRSPFAVERHQRAVHPALRNILQPVGGKPDDITVVVGVVVGGEQ